MVGKVMVATTVEIRIEILTIEVVGMVAEGGVLTRTTEEEEGMAGTHEIITIRTVPWGQLWEAWTVEVEMVTESIQCTARRAGTTPHHHHSQGQEAME